MAAQKHKRKIKKRKKIPTLEVLETIPPINIYINRINNRLVFKRKDGYKLDLQAPETIKLLDSTKKDRQNKKRRKISSLEVVEVVKVDLVQCHLADNQYQ